MKKTIVGILLVTITTIAAIGFSGCTRSSSVGNAISQTTVITSNSNQSSNKSESSSEEEVSVKKDSSKEEVSVKKDSSEEEPKKLNSSKIVSQRENSLKAEESKQYSSMNMDNEESSSELESKYEDPYYDDGNRNDEYDESKQDIPDTTSQIQNNLNEEIVNEEENENTTPNEEPYIVVSIEEQMLWYYECNTIVFSSPVVTGMDGGTPIGTFEILNKATNISLIGEDYESYVDYWIAFKGSGYGFHDASWRTEFGGDIYKYDGSHGCVNMPHDKVEQLYYMVKIGTPVYIIE